MEGNPLHIFKSVTDFIECHYTGELNLEALMGDPIASRMYDCFMVEIGENSRTYKKAMKIHH